jgi:hypothetical protein
MKLAAAVIFVALATGSAAAEPEPATRPWSVGIRAAIGYGTMEETTWAYPEVDVVGTLRLGDRGFISLAGGYTPIDNHTYLSDGRIYRLALASGGTIAARVRGAVTVSLDSVSFHADPDAATEHPGVDILASRGGLLPMAGIEAAYPIGESTLVGAFVRVALRDLELYDTPAGERGLARLWLPGVYIELTIR